ncbi:accessory Sec system protein Asp1 [Lactobacillaceae bacterium 24-114]
MNYLVPAWHTRLGDWAYGTPKLNFDDIVSVYGLLAADQQNCGLVITDYLPQLSTRLANIAMTPKSIFSVFDYLQGITRTDNQIIDYADFDWPQNAFFEFTPFRLIVRQLGKVYANVIFDMEGKINWVEYFNENGQHTKTLLMDSRGFVSRIEFYNENNQDIKDSYLNLLGEWRINHYPQNDSVEINPKFAGEFEKLHYDHLNDLVQEVVEKHFLDYLSPNDQLTVTIDDYSRIPQSIYNRVPTVFSASKWHPFVEGLKTLFDIPNLRIVTDTPFTAKKVQTVMNLSQPPLSIPLYQALFQLGHSQRIQGQRIYLFIDDLTPEELESLGTVILDHLMDHPKRDELYLFSYGGGQEKAEQFIKVVMKRHKDDFWLKGHEPEKKITDEGIEDDPRREEKQLPIITIEYKEFNDTPALMKSLDETRLLIDWGYHPDDQLQMAAVSIGIPVIQRIETPEIRDRQNGWICNDLLDLRTGLRFYLNDLKHWNESLANNVQIMNEYSADKLLEMWQAIWQQK